MERAGRSFAFAVAFVAIFGAFGGLFWSFGHAAVGLPSVRTGLCELSSSNNVVISAYLETHAEELNSPAGADDTPVIFVVRPGETAGDIAARLERQGLVSDATLFSRYVQYHDLDGGMEAGEFTLRQTMTIPDIARALQEARQPEQTITLREGLRLEQVAAEVARQTEIEEEAFLHLATQGWRDRPYASAFRAEVPEGATLEGFLYPDTYRLPEVPTADDVLERMLTTFEQRVTTDVRAEAARNGLSLYELVTLASIVEREAVVPEERPVIAGVYHNRLDVGQMLEACPTVQYALSSPDDWWPEFTLAATDVQSPYNTYENHGLPPGPICSPGLASIRAAANPADTDYFYFLVDCTKDDGSHLFAKTEEEHYANYARCGGQIP